MSDIFYNAEKREEKRKKLLEKYKNLSSGLLGRSILGRNIDYYKVGRGEKIIAAVGAHHALEYITIYALFDFLEFISEKGDAGITYLGVNLNFLLDKFTYYIIPCLNPDGVELHLSGAEKTPLYERQIRLSGGDFSDWQANARGVDLNHNYDYKFGEYKKIEAKEGIFAGKSRYSGEYPESEPETRAMANLIRTLRPAATVALHTQGEEIFVKPENERTKRISESLARNLGYRSSRAEGLAAYGGLVDYVGDSLKLFGVTAELGRGKNPLPENKADVISDAVRKLLILLPTYI